MRSLLESLWCSPISVWCQCLQDGLTQMSRKPLNLKHYNCWYAFISTYILHYIVLCFSYSRTNAIRCWAPPALLWPTWSFCPADHYRQCKDLKFKSSRLGISSYSAHSGPAHSLHKECNGSAGEAGHGGVLPEAGQDVASIHHTDGWCWVQWWGCVDGGFSDQAK